MGILSGTVAMLCGKRRTAFFGFFLLRFTTCNFFGGATTIVVRAVVEA